MMKKQESGRSMVEMLGVLAIIGVLSIGGIAGYTMAMNRYRANAVLDAANKYAVILYSGKKTADTMGSTYNIPGIEETGILPGSATTVSDATIVKPTQLTDIADDGVTLTINFDSDDVCKVAASSVGAATSDNKCSQTPPALTHEFKQS